MHNHIFEELYESYRKPLLGYFQRKGLDVHAAEDVFHDTMLGVLTDYDTLEQKEKTRQWIFGTARHKLGDWFRKKYRREAEELQDPIDIPQTDDDQERIETVVNEVFDVMALIPESNRRTLQAYYLQNQSLGVIAEKEGITHNCAKQWLYRSRERLKKKLCIA